MGRINSEFFPVEPVTIDLDEIISGVGKESTNTSRVFSFKLGFKKIIPVLQG